LITDSYGRLLFSREELQCKSSGGLLLAVGFAKALRRLRIDLGEKMIVNSCCRSRAHNARSKGHFRSLHVYDFPYWPTGGTCAIDIRVTSEGFKERLIELALFQGWSVGIAKTFVHIDRRTEVLNFHQTRFKYE